ncbi:MAG: DNA-processing protein DprA [Suilimivivens sp.]
MENKENAYRYWLHNIPELGEKAIRLLIDKYETAETLYHVPVEKVQNSLLESGWRPKVVEKKMQSYRECRDKWNVMENYEKMTKQGIHMVSIWDDTYPEKLHKLHTPPMILYYRGSLPDEKKCALAIIGARECSEYGAYTARAFGEQMGKAGISVISGMARGIDGIGQEAAHQAGGRTYAVLGCGVDICYPSSNKELYQAIQEKGGIISPFPPGTPPKKQLFPYRNSIVAGLSDAVLVVEARQKSGTWITVDMALEQGKDVYAVPGRLTDRLSDGCNLLIRQGAGIALAPEDIIAELAMLKNRSGKKKDIDHKRAEPKRAGERRKEPETGMEGEESAGFLRFLDLTPRSSDEILENIKAAGIDMTLPQLLFELIRLCMEGKAKQIGGNYFARKMN